MFLKKLCTFKRKLNVKEKVLVVSTKTPPKYKDPGYPMVTCIIGKQRINGCLLDLGASVNILLYLVYEQLGLGDLKPTEITLQLADRFVKAL